MAEPEPERQRLVVSGERPLIGVLEGDDTVRYFTDEVETEEGASNQPSVQRALSLLGAWSDLDWAEAEATLDRIRHATPPSPPLDL